MHISDADVLRRTDSALASAVGGRLCSAPTWNIAIDSPDGEMAVSPDGPLAVDFCDRLRDQRGDARLLSQGRNESLAAGWICRDIFGVRCWATGDRTRTSVGDDQTLDLPIHVPDAVSPF